jgi:hypothetical protein
MAWSCTDKGSYLHTPDGKEVHRALGVEGYDVELIEIPTMPSARGRPGRALLLHYAVETGDFPLVKYMLRRGADVERTGACLRALVSTARKARSR